MIKQINLRRLLVLPLCGLALLLFLLFRPGPIVSPAAPSMERNLEKYTFYNLQDKKFPPNQIRLEQQTQIKDTFITFTFSYLSDGKKISGLANIPQRKGKLPTIVMIRGYVDSDIYKPGMGTQRTAEVFAKNGFVTLAPDFLGYGQSDPPYKDPLESRFDAPQEVLNLLASISSLPMVDQRKVGLWGHSNGGQIALSVLEISTKPYPTALWAPVSLAFPESVLNYANEMKDEGVYLNQIIDDFTKLYDPQHYSITNYLGWITGPIQIHQGAADRLVPIKWSDTLVANLRPHHTPVTYFTYPGEDHNFTQGSWQTLSSRDLKFFTQKLKVY